MSAPNQDWAKRLLKMGGWPFGELERTERSKQIAVRTAARSSWRMAWRLRTKLGGACPADLAVDAQRLCKQMGADAAREVLLTSLPPHATRARELLAEPDQWQRERLRDRCEDCLVAIVWAAGAIPCLAGVRLEQATGWMAEGYRAHLREVAGE